MNNSDNRDWAIECATELAEGAAGLTIMAVIETAWNNLTPGQQQSVLDIYGREDYAAVAIPLDGPLTPHLTSEDWWDKDYGEENPALQQYLAEIGANLTRLNVNPKQIGNLWDGADTDSEYVYFHIYDFNRNIPDTAMSLQYAVSSLVGLLRRTAADNDEGE